MLKPRLPLGRRRAALLAVTIIALGASAGACSASDPVGTTTADPTSDASASDGTPNVEPTVDGGVTDAAGAVDATDAASAACNVLTLDGVEPATIARVKTAAPVPLGGAVADGVYRMRTVLVHGTTTSAPVPFLRVRLLAQGNTWQSITADPGATAKPPKAETVEIIASGTSFTLTPMCPHAASPQNYAYSAGLSDAGKAELHYFSGTAEVTEIILEKE